MTRVCILLGLLACSRVAMATDVTLLVGYQFNNDFDVEIDTGRAPGSPSVNGAGVGKVEIDDDVAFGLGVDFVFMGNQNQRLGVYLSHQQTRFENIAGLDDRGLDITHLHFTGMSYYPAGKFEPFVIAGVGVGFFSPGDSALDDETRFSMQIGAGANYQLGENLLLRFDVRWLPTFFNGSGSVFCSGGCTIRLSSDTYNQVQANAGLVFRF